jgi:2-methylcitrate dehydratase
MGLTEAQLRNAIGIAVVSHAAMGETREGHLTMWKGLAAGDAVKHAVYACRLAESGVEGPAEPFLGEKGYLNLLLKGEFADVNAFSGMREASSPRRILDTHIKAWPIGVVSQSGVDAALQISTSLDNFDDIELVEIETFKAAIQRNGSPEKWRPMTRETADHSLPFGVATALRDRHVNSASFDDDKVRSPVMHQFLAERVRLTEDPELTAGYPEGFPTRVTVRTRSGDVLVQEVTYPRGHARNPLNDIDLSEKFRTLASRMMSEDRYETLRSVILDIETATELIPLGELLKGRVGA